MQVISVLPLELQIVAVPSILVARLTLNLSSECLGGGVECKCPLDVKPDILCGYFRLNRRPSSRLPLCLH